MVHRFSKENAFNNSSVMCEALKIFYGHVFASMICSGYDENLLIHHMISDK